MYATLPLFMASFKAFFNSTLNRIKNLNVPNEGNFKVVILCGVLNLFLFGIGTLVMGVVNDVYEDVLIGVCQLIPVVGWIWSIGWGVMMIIRKLNEQRTVNDNEPQNVENNNP